MQPCAACTLGRPYLGGAVVGAHAQLTPWPWPCGPFPPPPTWLLFAPGALYGIGQPNANHIHQMGPAGPAGGGQRWPKDNLWHVGPFGTQSTILAKMRTLKILGTKVPPVLCCHMWHVGCLMWMWDSLIVQSKITEIFFRQGHRVRHIMHSKIR